MNHPSFEDEIPGECEQFELLLQQYLDGHLPCERIFEGHAELCHSCQQRAQIAYSILHTLPGQEIAEFPDQTDLIVNRALAERSRSSRIRNYRRSLAAVAVAGILIPVLLQTFRWQRPAENLSEGLPTQVAERNQNDSRSPVEENQSPENVSAPKVRPIVQVLNNAGATVTDYSRRGLDSATSLWPTSEKVDNASVVAITDQPAAVGHDDSLSRLPTAVQTGIEPVSNSAKNAWNLLMRDTGLARMQKPNS